MALSANTQREKQSARPPVELAVPVNAGSHIYAGAIVMREAATNVFVPGADTASCKYGGVAMEELDNTSGADGVVDGDEKTRGVRIERNGVYEFAVNGATPKPLQAALIYDDNTVSAAATTNSIQCGLFLRPGPNGGWFVDTLYANV